MTKYSASVKRLTKKETLTKKNTKIEDESNKYESFDNQEKWLFKQFDITSESLDTLINPRNDMFNDYILQCLKKRVQLEYPL